MIHFEERERGTIPRKTVSEKQEGERKDIVRKIGCKRREGKMQRKEERNY
jgi:hypothetical protein